MNQKDKENLKNVSLTSGGVASVYAGKKLLDYSEKSVKSFGKGLGPVAWVVEGEGKPDPKIIGAQVTNLEELKNSKKPFYKNLIGVLGGKSLFEPKYKSQSLKDFTKGKVITDFPETANLMEDHYEFYKSHKNPESYLPKTILADKIKTKGDLDKTFGKDNYILKKRISHSGKGVISSNSNRTQIENLNNAHRKGKPWVSKMEDLIGDQDYIFQEKLQLATPDKSEFRITVARGQVLDVLKRNKKGDLSPVSNRFILSSKKAKEFDDMAQFAQSYVSNSLRANPDGVHTLDVVKDTAGKKYILETNAAGGGNLRINTALSGRRVTKAIEDGTKPMSHLNQMRFNRGALALGVLGTATAGYGASKLIKGIKNE